jgi:hypothetical protein
LTRIFLDTYPGREYSTRVLETKRPTHKGKTMEPLNWEEAVKEQHLYSSYYTVWLVNAEGKRVAYCGRTQRKSGSGLIAKLRTEAVQKLVAEKVPDVANVEFKKTAAALKMSNGWSLQFGGTIRQEAAEAQS